MRVSLHGGVRPPPGARIREADRLHGSEPEGVLSPPGHDFHREAPFEVGHRVELMALVKVAGFQSPQEGSVLFLVHGAVEVVGILPEPPCLEDN